MNENLLKQFTSSVKIADVLGENLNVIRRAEDKLVSLGLITTKPHNKGTIYRLTEKGKRYVRFNTENFSEFSEVQYLLRKSVLWRLLSIVQSLTDDQDATAKG